MSKGDDSQYSWARNGLDSMSLDWKWILGMLVGWMGVVFFPSLFIGVAFFVLWCTASYRKWGWREAIVSLFLVSCVLANSREVGMQYWKLLRLVAACFVLLEGWRVFVRSEPKLRSRWLIWLGLLGVCTVVPSLVSMDVEDGILQSVLISSMWFSMVVLSHVPQGEPQHLRAQSLVHLGIVVIAISILSGVLQWPFAFLAGRFRGVFGNPNSISHWWLLFFILGLSGTHSLRGPRSLVLVTFTLVVLYWAASRGAALACLAALIGWMLFRFQVSTVVKALLLLCIGGLFLGDQYSFRNHMEEILPEHIVRAETLEEGGGRFLAWEHALEEIMDSPWVGHGGGYEERFFDNSSSYFIKLNHQGLSHNSWIAFAMNFGIPLSILLIMGLLVFLRLHESKFWLIALLPIVFSFSIEGYLTAPMSAISPALFFVGGFLGSFRAKK
tara:strand:+ start:1395 stop:2717 length:1323 start_codon:yes stop_codon:yes gene_type:complete